MLTNGRVVFGQMEDVRFGVSAMAAIAEQVAHMGAQRVFLMVSGTLNRTIPEIETSAVRSATSALACSRFDEQDYWHRVAPGCQIIRPSPGSSDRMGALSMRRIAEQYLIALRSFWMAERADHGFELRLHSIDGYHGRPAQDQELRQGCSNISLLGEQNVSHLIKSWW